MTSIEQIVRPFQRTDVFNARVAPVTTQPIKPEPEPPVQIEIVGSHNGQFVEEPPPFVNNFTVDWEEDKSRRVTSTERVENPDDPSQFVDVERVDQVVFKNDKTREELKLKMDWD